MTQPDIEGLKREHGALYSLNIRGTVFLFRQLTLEEYAKVDAKEQSPELEDCILDAGVVHPKPIPELRPGEYTNICGAILGVSGWSDDAAFFEVLDEKRRDAFSHHPEAKALICTYFNLSPVEVEGMKFEEFLSYVAQVELITGKRIYTNKKERIQGALRQPLQHQHRAPATVPSAVGNKWAPPQLFDALRSSGIEPAEDQLSRRIEEETGNIPVSIAKALERKKQRPNENLSRGDVARTVISRTDHPDNPDAWTDGPPI
jgi:hypothetical protein